MSKKVRRTETLSIRINPQIKAGLAAAANYGDSTMSTVIEYALQAGIDSARIPADEVKGLFREKYTNDESVSLGLVMKYAWHDNPILMNLRLFHIFPKGLGERDRIVCSIALTHPRFSGDNNIYYDSPSIAEGAPSVDLAKIHLQYDDLVGFADFKIHEAQRPVGSLSLDFDTYLRLRSQSEKSRESSSGKFFLKKSANGHFYFVLVKANGEVILTSQMYASKASALSGIEAVRRNAQRKESFVVRQGADSKYHFIVKALNGEIVGVSESFTAKESVDKVVDSVRAYAPDAALGDDT